MQKYYIIYTSTGMVFSQKHYNSWQEIQDEYENYISSLEFDSIEELREYVISEYSETDPFLDQLPIS